ncbi:putative signal peptide peptidase SppA [Pseudovibrio axinellae]|uniref:Putative signal peptide peptidase SppA n=1 Tax=Pseudovibrio axinellae TaxID=989403 RepID=A0A165YZY2_9HYPH|nr:signal peptide peptidase SppA [Pseudovibrio axinellae]KZL19385.1 putative signal peptide peptidase SppA [Pseudovibrio axinellae]SEQ38607.1 signal peptide peptidase A. Serine peptidase. MEROPS family S49 [Pseudovibrio axinellae]
MSLDSDVLIDRRRLRRKVSFWRVISFIALAALLLWGGAEATGFGELGRSENHIARIEISGPITYNRRQLKMLEAIADDDSVEGVIVSVNSPGGTTSGGEALYNALRKIAEKKPVTASITTLGASAAYLSAIASDHLVAQYTSLTGSIGVLFQYGNAKGLLDKIGVEMAAIKSAPLKAEPNFYEPATPEVKEALQDLIDDSYMWFVGLVAERRGLSKERAIQLANGQVYTGHQAKTLGLVDKIGGEEAALSWLVEEKGLSSDLEVIDWKPESEERILPFPANLLGYLGSENENLLHSLLKTAKSVVESSLPLDGLVSVWQAPDAATVSALGGAKHD